MIRDSLFSRPIYATVLRASQYASLGAFRIFPTTTSAESFVLKRGNPGLESGSLKIASTRVRRKIVVISSLSSGKQRTIWRTMVLTKVIAIGTFLGAVEQKKYRTEC